MDQIDHDDEEDGDGDEPLGHILVLEDEKAAEHKV